MASEMMKRKQNRELPKISISEEIAALQHTSPRSQSVIASPRDNRSPDLNPPVIAVSPVPSRSFDKKHEQMTTDFRQFIIGSPVPQPRWSSSDEDDEYEGDLKNRNPKRNDLKNIFPSIKVDNAGENNGNESSGSDDSSNNYCDVNKSVAYTSRSGLLSPTFSPYKSLSLGNCVKYYKGCMKKSSSENNVALLGVNNENEDRFGEGFDNFTQKQNKTKSSNSLESPTFQRLVSPTSPRRAPPTSTLASRTTKWKMSPDASPDTFLHKQYRSPVSSPVLNRSCGSSVLHHSPRLQYMSSQRSTSPMNKRKQDISNKLHVSGATIECSSSQTISKLPDLNRK